ncbi:transposase [Thermodesulfobacteriota bacterium]
MPRNSRIDAPGALHHIIARGIERRLIFGDDDDRDDFIQRLGTVLSETATVCYAWALIPNHFHLLLRTGKTSISTVMRRVLTGYAIGYNHRHRRSGHLFQNRFKSILCQEDPYFKELVRYIHLNPLRAKIVPDLKSLNRYPYSGHSALMGKRTRDWQSTEYVLGLFGNSIRSGKRSYGEFIKKGVGKGNRPDLVGGGLVRSAGGWTALKSLRQTGFRQKADERILGDGDFVSEVLQDAQECLERKYRLRSAGYDFDKIVRKVGRLLKLQPQQVITSGKRRHEVEARNIVCYWASRELGISQVSLAQKFDLSQPAISAAIQRGEKIVTERQLQLE